MFEARKRVLAVVLALCMVITGFPVMNLPVAAEDPEAPKIVGVANIVVTKADASEYIAGQPLVTGDIVTFGIEYSVPVSVQGTPVISMNANSGNCQAVYTGNGALSNNVEFTYTVKADDATPILNFDQNIWSLDGSGVILIPEGGNIQTADGLQAEIILNLTNSLAARAIIVGTPDSFTTYGVYNSTGNAVAGEDFVITTFVATDKLGTTAQENVTVEWILPEGATVTVSNDSISGTLAANEYGSFISTIKGLSAGQQQLTLKLKSNGQVFSMAPMSIDVQPDPNANPNPPPVGLTQGVFGKVKRAATDDSNVPVTVTVGAYRSQGMGAWIGVQSTNGTFDAQGEFHYALTLDPGDYYLKYEFSGNQYVSMLYGSESRYWFDGQKTFTISSDTVVEQPDVIGELGHTVSGTVKLPSGQSAEGTQVELYARIPENKEISHTTVAFGAGDGAEVPFSMVVPAGEYRFFVRSYNNLFSSFYIGANGQGWGFGDVTNMSVADNVALGTVQLQKSISVSGNLVIPTALENDVEFIVTYLKKSTQNDYPDYSVYTYGNRVTLLKGNTSVAYYLNLPASGDYFVQIQTMAQNTNFPSIFWADELYDGTNAYNGDIHPLAINGTQTQNFQIPFGTVLSGKIQLPNGILAPYNTHVNLSVNLNNSSNGIDVTIPEGQNEATFRFVVPGTQGAIISAYLQDQVAGVYREAYFGDSSSTFVNGEAEKWDLTPGGNYSNLVFTMFEGNDIAVELTRDADVNIGKTLNFQVICAPILGGNWIYSNSFLFGSNEFTKNVTFTIPKALTGKYRLGYNLYRNYQLNQDPEGIREAYIQSYDDNGCIMSPQNSAMTFDITANTTPTSVKMHLQRGIKLSGHVQFPEVVSSSDYLGAFVDLNLNQQYFGHSYNSTPFISGTSVPFSVYTYPGYDVFLNLSLPNNLRVQYVGNLGQDLGVIDVDKTDIVLTVEKGNTVSGTVTIPSALPQNAYFGIHFYNRVGQLYYSTSVQIEKGKTQANYAFAVPNGSYVVYLQSQSYDRLVTRSFYSEAGMQTSEDLATPVVLLDAQKSLDLQAQFGYRLDVEVIRPDTSNREMSVPVVVDVQSGNGVYFGQSVIIEKNTDFGVATLVLPAGDYVVSYRYAPWNINPEASEALQSPLYWTTTGTTKNLNDADLFSLTTDAGITLQTVLAEVPTVTLSVTRSDATKPAQPVQLVLANTNGTWDTGDDTEYHVEATFAAGASTLTATAKVPAGEYRVGYRLAGDAANFGNYPEEAWLTEGKLMNGWRNQDRIQIFDDKSVSIDLPTAYKLTGTVTRPAEDIGHVRGFNFVFEDRNGTENYDQDDTMFVKYVEFAANETSKQVDIRLPNGSYATHLSFNDQVDPYVNYQPQGTLTMSGTNKSFGTYQAMMGHRVSGTIRLPEGAKAAAVMNVSVEFHEESNAQNNGQDAYHIGHMETIAQGASEASYSFVLPEGNYSAWYEMYSLTAGVIYENNQDKNPDTIYAIAQRGFIDINGATIPQEGLKTKQPIASDKQDFDFTLIPATWVHGYVQLGEVATTATYIDVHFWDEGADLERWEDNITANASVMLTPGSSGADYIAVVPDGKYRVAAWANDSPYGWTEYPNGIAIQGEESKDVGSIMLEKQAVIKGVFELPESLQGHNGFSVIVNAEDAGGTYRERVYGTFIDIEPGVMSVPYSILAPAGNYRLYYELNGDSLDKGVYCAYVGAGQMLPRRLDAKIITTQLDIETTQDMTLMTGTKITGKVTRPTGTPDGDILVYVRYALWNDTLWDHNGDDSFPADIVISDGEDEAAYSIIVPSGYDYFSYVQTEENSVEGIFGFAALGETGMLIYTNEDPKKLTISGDSYLADDMTFVDKKLITGTLHRPAGALNEDISLWIEAEGQNDERPSVEVVLLKNTQTVDFEVPVLGGNYKLTVRTRGDQGIVNASFYDGTDLTYDEYKRSQSVVPGADYQLHLVGGQLISGTLSRPAENKNGKLGILLVIASEADYNTNWDTNPRLLYWFDMEDGIEALDYTVTVPAGKYYVTTWIDQERSPDEWVNDRFVDSSYYASGKTVYDSKYADVVTVGNTSIDAINLLLAPWKHITGKVLRPAGIPSAAITDLIVEINGDQWSQQRLTIEENEPYAEFDFKVHPSDNIKLLVTNMGDENVIQQLVYTGENKPMSPIYEDMASINATAGNVENLHLQLLSGTQLKGTISAEGLIGDDEISFNVDAIHYNETANDGSEDYRLGRNYTLKAGDGSLDYCITVPSDGKYVIQVSKDEGEYVTQSMYSENGTVYNWGQATWIEANAPAKSGLDVTLVKWQHVQGTFYRPAGYALDQEFRFSVHLQQVNPDGSDMQGKGAFIAQDFVLDAGAASMTFDVNAVPGAYQIRCIADASEHFVANNFYTGSQNLVSPYYEDGITLPEAPVMSGIKLTCIPAAIITGVVNRAANDDALQDCWVQIVANEIHDGPDERMIEKYVQIPEGQTSATYAMGLPAGTYKISYNVWDKYPSMWLNEAGDAVFNMMESKTVTISSNTTTSTTMLETTLADYVTLTGTIYRPTGMPTTEPLSVTPVWQHNIGLIYDMNELSNVGETIEIPAGANSVTFTLHVPPEKGRINVYLDYEAVLTGDNFYQAGPAPYTASWSIEGATELNLTDGVDRSALNIRITMSEGQIQYRVHRAEGVTEQPDQWICVIAHKQNGTPEITDDEETTMWFPIKEGESFSDVFTNLPSGSYILRLIQFDDQFRKTLFFGNGQMVDKPEDAQVFTITGTTNAPDIRTGAEMQLKWATYLHFQVDNVLKSQLDMNKGDVKNLTVVTDPANATVGSIQYLTSDASVATVNANGEVTAVAGGQATITAVAQGFEKAVIDITVSVPVGTVTIQHNGSNINELKMVRGTFTTVSAVVAPLDATQPSIVYTSSNETVAEIHAVYGVINALSAGSTTITATAENGKSASFVLTVYVPGQSIDIQKDGQSITELHMTKSQTTTLTVVVSPADATDKVVSFSSSDATIVSIGSQTGIVEAKAGGTVTITAQTAEGIKKEIQVTVTVPTTGVSILVGGADVGSLDLHKLDRIQLTAVVMPVDATDKSVTFSSSDETVATVDATGEVHVVGVGTTVITAEASGYTDTITITATIAVSNVILQQNGTNVTAINLVKNENTTLAAVVLPADATYPAVMFSSANELVATVDMFGKVTAIDEGTTTITAETANGVKATCTVSVATPQLLISGISNNALVNTNVKVTATSSLQQITISEGGQPKASGVGVVTYEFSTEGIHNVTISNGKDVKAITFTIDKTAPIITITGVTNDQVFRNAMNGATPIISINEQDVIKTAQLDGVSYAEGATVKAPGMHTFFVSTRDKAGNMATKTVQFEIRYDQMAPVIVVSAVEEGKVYKQVQTSVAVDDDASLSAEDTNLANYALKTILTKDGALVGTYNRGDTIPNLTAEGNYRMEIVAVNPSYITKTVTKTITFQVDNTIPVVTLGTIPATTNKTVVPTYTLSDNLAAQAVLEANKTVTLTRNGTPVLNYHLGDPIATDGVYVLSVVTKDNADNVSATKTVNFTIDQTKPVITVSGAVQGFTYKDPAGGIKIQVKSNEGTVAVQATGTTLPEKIVEGLFDTYTFIGTEDAVQNIQLSFEAVDTAGNKSSSSLAFTIDRLAVNLMILGVTEGLVTKQDPTISALAYNGETEIETGLSMTIDGTSFAGGVYTVEGSHVLVAQLVQGGNTYTKTVTFTLDKTAPSASISNVSKSGATQNSSFVTKSGDVVRVRATITDSNGIADVNLRISGRAEKIPMTLVNGVYEGEWTVDNGNDNAAEMMVTAFDKAGNSRVIKWSNTFAVDNIKPVVSVSTTPVTPAGQNGMYISPEMTVTLTAGTGETIAYHMNGAAGSATTTKTLMPAQGTNILIYSATDAAGNTGDQKIFTFAYDSVKPNAPTLSVDVNKLVNAAGLDITGSVTGETAGTVIVSKKAAAGTYETVAFGYVSTNGQFTVSGLTLNEGANEFRLQSMDFAGNLSSTQTTLTRTLDTSKPVLAIEASGDNFVMTANETVTGVTATWNGEVANVDLSNTITKGTMQEGSNVLLVTATDAAGNIGSGSLTISYIPVGAQDDVKVSDNTTIDIPAGAFNAETNMTVRTVEMDASIDYKPLTAPLNFDFSVAPSQPILIRMFVGFGLTGVTLIHDDDGVIGERLATATTSGSIVLDELTEDQPYYLTDTGEIVFRTKNFSSYQAAQDQTAPTILDSSAPATINAGSWSSAVWAGKLSDKDPDVAISQVLVDGVSMGLSSVTLSGAVAVNNEKQRTFSIDLEDILTEGSHNVTITVKDSAGNTASATKTIVIDKTLVVLTAVPQLTLTRASQMQLQVTTSENATISISKNGGSYTDAGNVNGTGAVTVALDEGSNSFVVRATDAFGNITTSNAIVVNKDATPPVITSNITDGDVFGGDKVVTVSANEGTLVLVLDGATINNNTTVSAEGSHTLVATATDTAGNITVSEVRFTIDSSVPTIAVTGFVNQSVTAGSVTYTVASANADTLSVTRSVNGGAAVPVTVASFAAVETITPVNGETNTYTIRVVASKTVAGQVRAASSTYVFTIDKKAPVLSLNAIADTTAVQTNLTGTVNEVSDIYLGNTLKQSAVQPGTFIISDVALNMGDNTFIIKAVDTLGNESTKTITVKRVTADQGGNPGGGIALPPPPVILPPQANVPDPLPRKNSNELPAVEEPFIGIAVGGAEATNIGSTGGSISTSDGAISLTIPAGSVTGTNNTFQVVVFELDAKSNLATQTRVASGQLKVISDIVHIATSANRLAKPVSATFSFDKTKVTNPANLRVFYWNTRGRTWVPVPDNKAVLNTTSGTITVQLNHFSLYAVMETKAPLKFSDVNSQWFAPFVERLAMLGATEGSLEGGVRLFKPEQAITRAEFVVMLCKAMNIAPISGELAFSDAGIVPGYAKGYVKAAVTQGIINGYGDGSFKPSNKISRADMVLMIIRAIGIKTDGAKVNFADTTAIPVYAKAAVAKAFEKGIISGKGSNLFMPLATATRGEVAKVLVEMLEVLAGL